jgi:hypothetical protein
MAELNFGLLTPPGSESIGNAFVRGQDQARASQMQDMQMQRGQRQDQMAEMQLRKAQATEAKLNQFYEGIAANGGPKSPIEIEDKMIGSGIPDVAQKGLAARSARLQVEEGRKLFGEAMNATAPAAAAAAAAPPPAAAAAPQGDMLGAGNQLMPGLVNNMPGAAPAPAVNNMQGALARPDVAALTAKRNGLLALGTPQALAAVRAISQEISDASRPDQFMNVPGVGAVNPRTREVVVPSVAPAVAPTLTTVEDPTKPGTYLQVDARAYKGGGLNSPGVIGNARPPAPGAVVSLPRLESQEAKEKGSLNVATYKGISDAARLAAKSLPALETQTNILNSADFSTGFGTNAKKAAASVLAALGVPEAETFATNAQTFLAATQQAVLQRQLEQKGPQTESDAQRITQTGAQLGNTPAANKFIIDVAKAQFKRDMDQRNFFDKWYTANKTYEGAEATWYGGEGGKSLFDRPELKAYAPKAQASTSAPRAAPGATPGVTVGNW